jgi:hypothetical protein
LRCLWPQGLRGSSPLSDTLKMKKSLEPKIQIFALR